MKEKLHHLRTLLAVAICAIFALSMTSCGDDDDDDPAINITGTWQITSTTDLDWPNGSVVTFGGNGVVTLIEPDGDVYNDIIWNMSGNNLSVTYVNNDGTLDDSCTGVISGNDATFTFVYNLVDCDSGHVSSTTYAITFVRVQ